MSGPIHVGVSLHPRPWRNSRKFHSSQSMEKSASVEGSLPAAEGSRHVRAYSCRKFLFIPDHGGIGGSFITHSPWRNQLLQSAHGQPLRGHVTSGSIHVGSLSSSRPWRNSRKFIIHRPWRNQLLWRLTAIRRGVTSRQGLYSWRKLLFIPDHGGIM